MVYVVSEAVPHVLIVLGRWAVTSRLLCAPSVGLCAFIPFPISRSCYGGLDPIVISTPSGGGVASLSSAYTVGLGFCYLSSGMSAVVLHRVSNTPSPQPHPSTPSR